MSKISVVNDLLIELRRVETKRRQLMDTLRECSWLTPGPKTGSGKLPDEDVVTKAEKYRDEYERAEAWLRRAHDDA